MDKPTTHKVWTHIFSDAQAAEAFSCPRCRYVPLPDYALWHPPCGAVFCQYCAEHLQGADCLKCLKPLSLELVKEKNPLGYQYGRELDTRCPFLGCKWTGKFKDFPEHATTCEKSKFFCSFQSYGCTFEGNIFQLMTHLVEGKKSHEERLRSAGHWEVLTVYENEGYREPAKKRGRRTRRFTTDKRRKRLDEESY